MIAYETGSVPNFLKEYISLPIHEESQVVVSTQCTWDYQQDIQSLLNNYKNTNKTVFVFLISDKTIMFKIPINVRLYRTSLFASQRQDNEYVLPYIWEPIKTRFSPLQKTEKPKVGFCGLNSLYRQKTLSLLQQSGALETDFIIKEQFWGGSPHNPALVSEFESNIQNNHFTVCNRGAGNFSMRFYQVLSGGRIPILLNTDQLLPLEELIDWSDLIVTAHTEELLLQAVQTFWLKKDIIEAQNRCYDIYERYFSGTKYLDSVLSE